MREILFRGKPIVEEELMEPNETLKEFFKRQHDWSDYGVDEAFTDDGFVIGQVVYDGKKAWIVGEVVEAKEDYITLEYWVPVKPETVGQKSGLKERPGTKDIWQGDVVKITLMDTIRDKPIISDTCSVELRNGMFGVEWGNDGHFIPLAQFAPGTRVEVIGVFCDNPELLEVLGDE